MLAVTRLLAGLGARCHSRESEKRLPRLSVPRSDSAVDTKGMTIRSDSRRPPKGSKMCPGFPSANPAPFALHVKGFRGFRF